MFASKFIRFLVSILKPQVSFFPNFASFFIFITHNSSVNFQLIDFLHWINGSHQSPNFETFECSSESLPNSSCHLPSNQSVFLEVLRYSPVSRKITPLYFFGSNIYLGQKEPIKVQILRLLNARSEVLQTFHVNIETKNQVLTNFALFFIFMTHNVSVDFRVLSNIPICNP